jgi:hypothetical protein
VGDTYLGGQLKLVEATGPDAGSGLATFVVENTSNEDLEDVTASIRFYRPPTSGAQDYDVEIQDQNLNFFAGSRTKVSATPSDPELVKSCQLLILPLTTVADPVTGSEFLEGALRCVEIQPHLTAEKPSVTFSLKNVSTSPVEAPQFRVVFRRGRKVVTTTEWETATGGPVSPGDVLEVSPDLSKVDEDLGGCVAVLQIQKLIL